MNKKFLSVIVGIALFSSSALAVEESGFFIGADAAYVQTKVKGDLKHNKTGAVFNGDLSSSIPILGLRMGYRFNDLHRLYAAYNYSDEFSDIIRTPNLRIEGDFNTHKFLLGYDFTPEIFKRVRAVAGGYLGYAKTSIDLKTSLLSLSQDFDGFVYGAKIGAIFELGASNEIEVGFKAEQIEYNTRNYYQETIGSNFYDPRQTNYGLYLGYTYKF
ncbi:outer membrane beta-barrel protein [Campylobacter coli]|uniref:outer membrane beta-barrel protein n=1 Tax=Campylobacter coli TaxID=195 RepID=UPI000699FF78|nr:outer membrane beta-barrel protein [Campylobacter coli]EDO7040010.1 porin family protein [Campylobacter coli]MDP8500337.1 outer membrane beta-barrel protein [Campylobacter coli]HEE6706452.1 outer membrane beta-barrel protein [Campylobacter coli]HEF1275490.1 outer membrane beta-barrel protein [Campylobacter coli]HEF3883381.1 outer membrane beta-barrel protein [Campylobacter coli]